MAEVIVGRRQLFEVVEQGYIGRGQVCHGVFTTREEADRRFAEVARQQPHLAQQGALWVAPRYVETVQEPAGKMRRHYEDKQLRLSEEQAI